jgi:dTDP-4-amino-4,6-dideoxygalactose transaminase
MANLETSYPRIAVAAPTLNGNEKRYVLECLETTWISSIGRFISEFERGFARFCGVEHAIAVNNGTTALHLALLAHGIGPGDEVITTPFSFVATVNTILLVGATPAAASTRIKSYLCHVIRGHQWFNRTLIAQFCERPRRGDPYLLILIF